MRPPRNHHNPPSTAGNAGFEVRVIGGRAADQPREGGEVEIGLRIGSGPPAVLLEQEPAVQVHRLEAPASPGDPLRARPMSEAGPAAPYVPRRSRRERSMTRWTAGMAAGTCLLAVAAVATLLLLRKQTPPEVSEAIVFSTEAALGGDKAYFIDNLASLKREADALLKQYTSAQSPDDVLPLVKDSTRVSERLKQLWKPFGGLSSSPVESALAENEIRPALMLTGTKGDFSRFELIFVRESDRLKLDWEASFGIGDAQLGELRSSATVVKDAKVRVFIQPGNFYTPEFPEKDFHSYQLLDADKSEFVWAFARRGTRTATTLDLEFNESSVLLQRSTVTKATLKISGPLREGVNLFEITEMLHKGWVSP